MQASKAARDTILSSIRESLAASSPFDAIHSEHHAKQNARANRDLVEGNSVQPNINTLAEIFCKNLESVGGNCRIVGNDLAATRAIEEIVSTLDAKRVAISDAPAVRNLCSTLSNETEILTNASAKELFACDVGITAAQYAIAETGTLVLESEHERNRLTSLVPPVHICLLDARAIFERMIEVLEILHKNGREKLDRAVTFITGPSRTSDIELTLAIGVHGPRELHVIVMNNV